ncbi:MAG: circadian clock protein KaiC [Myxococcales bacterium]|nr:circadian clock protein KaiC [Myxococcales bacterium]
MAGKSSTASNRIPTRISGFDQIADGGLPRNGLTLVVGEVGTGKTIFGMQVLCCGAREDGEPGILVAFEESPGRVRANTANFSWGNPDAGQVEIIDAQLSQSIEQAGDFDLLGLLSIVGARATALGARRVVFDGIDVLLNHLRDRTLIRREAFRLRDWVHASGLAAIVTAKAHASDSAEPREYDFLAFIADCVVTLDHRVVQGTALRHIRVAKYRGAPHSANEYPLAITPAGIEVAVNTTVELGYAVSTERVSSGIERLDAMLSGGYYRGSSVLISGMPGTAKTSLAASFANAAAARGERTVYVSFDESPDQIVRNVASIGLKFVPHIAAGTLHIHAMRGRSESPEAQVARIRGWIRDVAPRNLVIDPLSALAQHGEEANRENAALQILDLCKHAGITVFCTSLLGNPLPHTEHALLNVSTIADIWMHVSYMSHGGERNRALTIIKARGTGHSNQVRELVLTDAGVTLANVYAVDGEVLMGTLRWEKENDARRTRTASKHAAILREQKAELALAETQAHLMTLSRARAIQEAELAQLRAVAVTEAGDRAGEADELLLRRRADTEEAELGPGQNKDSATP